jgi:hypothetical protein
MEDDPDHLLPRWLEAIMRQRTRKKDEQRSIGLGPEHDWSSHAADAFGLMAVAYEGPSRKARFNRKIEYPQLGMGDSCGPRL